MSQLFLYFVLLRCCIYCIYLFIMERNGVRSSKTCDNKLIIIQTQMEYEFSPTQDVCRVKYFNECRNK